MLAIPVLGDEVAPSFCSANDFIVAESSGEGAPILRSLHFPEEAWLLRLRRLSVLGVTVLLCGGFNRSFLPIATSLGIRVIFGLAGRADRLIEAFLQDELEQFRFLPCAIGSRGRHRGGRRRGAHRGEY